MQFVQSTFLLCRFLVQLIFYSFTIVILFYFAGSLLFLAHCVYVEMCLL